MHHNIQLEIENNYEEMSKKAAQLFSQDMKKRPKGAFGFATGSTPIAMYRELVRMNKDEGLDFSGIATFNLDEYHPLEKNSEHSYYYFMQEHLFGKVNVDHSRVFLPDGMASDTELESDEYEKKIKLFGGIEMQILGIGLNGHIGFNEPSDSFAADTRLVPLADVTINANAIHFEKQEDVPRHALTMGIRTIMLSKTVLLMANGAAKSEILRDALLGPITPLVPASALQLHPRLIVVADREAAALL